MRFTRRNLRPFRRLFTTRANSGVAALEFGLVAPVFFIVLAGSVDFGDEIYVRFRLDAALASASNYVLVNHSKVGSTYGAGLASDTATLVMGGDAASAVNGTVVVNNGPKVTITAGVAASSGTAGNADKFYCPSGSPSSGTFWGSIYGSTTACTGGGVAGQFVTITVSYNYSPIITGYAFVHSGTISASTVIQTQ